MVVFSLIPSLTHFIFFRQLYQPSSSSSTGQLVNWSTRQLFSILITNSTYGMKVAGIAAIVFEVFTKVQYEVVDGARSGIYVVAPNRLQDLFPWHHIILVFE